MKTEKELNADILKITATIQARFPELSKYIIEMPANNADNDGLDVNIKNLQDYYDSLDALLKNYDTYHKSAAKHAFRYSQTNLKINK
jgi:hypothetical protein